MGDPECIPCCTTVSRAPTATFHQPSTYAGDHTHVALGSISMTRETYEILVFTALVLLVFVAIVAFVFIIRLIHKYGSTTTNVPPYVFVS